jgi:transposase InsO family protein
MMSQDSKRELLDALRPRYGQASRSEKGRLLDEYVLITGYHRKYLIHLLRHPPPSKTRRKRKGKSRYNLPVQAALVKVWRAANCICGKRLVPCMEHFVCSLERHGELNLNPETRSLLLQMSAATADRLLQRHRLQHKRRGLSTTKPGTLLKQRIPIRTFSEWDDHCPGFVQIDLVAHCDDSTGGQYLYSLVLVDVATAWTECVAVPNKGQKAVFEALCLARQRLPFPMLGLHSDNGSEFINDQLFRYCQQEGLTFTRSRPYKKNDQAYVEQKNWTVVRQFVGYDRYQGPKALLAMQALYTVLRLYVNFFQPVMKYVSKKRVGSKLIKHYDAAMTPYHRALAAAQTSPQKEQELQQLYLDLNPAALLRHIHQLQDLLWSLAVRSYNEATNRLR